MSPRSRSGSILLFSLSRSELHGRRHTNSAATRANFAGAHVTLAAYEFGEALERVHRIALARYSDRVLLAFEQLSDRADVGTGQP
jgi:hypothetical protein